MPTFMSQIQLMLIEVMLPAEISEILLKPNCKINLIHMELHNSFEIRE